MMRETQSTTVRVCFYLIFRNCHNSFLLHIYNIWLITLQKFYPHCCSGFLDRVITELLSSIRLHNIDFSRLCYYFVLSVVVRLLLLIFTSPSVVWSRSNVTMEYYYIYSLLYAIINCYYNLYYFPNCYKPVYK